MTHQLTIAFQNWLEDSREKANFFCGCYRAASETAIDRGPLQAEREHNSGNTQIFRDAVGPAIEDVKQACLERILNAERVIQGRGTRSVNDDQGILQKWCEALKAIQGVWRESGAESDRARTAFTESRSPSTRWMRCHTSTRAISPDH